MTPVFFFCERRLQMFNVKLLFNNVKNKAIEKSPELLIGFGFACMLTSTVLAVKETPKALRLIEEEKDRINEELELKAERDGTEVEYVDELTKREIIKVTWKCYIKSGIAACIGGILIYKGTDLYSIRNVFLASAYDASRNFIKNYRDEVVKSIGEDKEKEIMDKIDRKNVDESIMTRLDPIYAPGYYVKDIFKEADTDREFMSSLNEIDRACNEINYKMLINTFASRSDFYDIIGIGHTSKSDYEGWNIYEDGMIMIISEPDVTKDGRPCMTIRFSKEPRNKFDIIG